MDKILDLIMVNTKLSRAEGEKLAQEIEDALTAQEGECERCKHLENKCKEWHDKYRQKQDELVALQVATTWGDTAQEGEFISVDHAAETWLCSDCARKLSDGMSDNQIAKRKIEEFYRAEGLTQYEIVLLARFNRWLDQEGEE